MGVYLGRNAVEVYGGGVKIKPEEEKTVTASTSTIEVIPTKGKAMNKVTVNPTPSEEKTVTPSATQQTVSPSTGKLLSQVTVDGDADLIPANIRQGVNIFGVDGKTSVIDTEDTATLKADENFKNLIDSTIGDAIRNKNGSTGTLTLDGMVTAINDMASVTIDGVKVKEKLDLRSEMLYENKSVSTLPYNFYIGSAVVFNNEIHILGSYVSSYRTKHYKFDGSTWTQVSTLPYNFYRGSAVVLGGEIHILGGTDADKQHYKFDGSTWTQVSTLPYYFSNGSAVVFDNEIHIMGGDSGDTKHYKWNGSSWTSVSTLPYFFRECPAVVLNGEIYILGGATSTYMRSCCKWDGSTWTEVNTLPYEFYSGSAVILEDEIHIMGGSNNSYGSTDMLHYKFDGSTWTQVSTLPYHFYNGSSVVLGDEIHIMGSADSSYRTSHYSLSLKVYRKVG